MGGAGALVALLVTMWLVSARPHVRPTGETADAVVTVKTIVAGGQSSRGRPGFEHEVVLPSGRVVRLPAREVFPPGSRLRVRYAELTNGGIRVHSYVRLPESGKP